MGTALSFVVFDTIMASPTFSVVLAGQIWLNASLAFISGPGVATSVEMLPPLRLIWMATGYSVALATFGGFTPAAVTALVAVTASPTSPSLQLIAASAVISAVILLAPETAVRAGIQGNRGQQSQNDGRLYTVSGSEKSAQDS